MKNRLDLNETICLNKGLNKIVSPYLIYDRVFGFWIVGWKKRSMLWLTELTASTFTTNYSSSYSADVMPSVCF